MSCLKPGNERILEWHELASLSFSITSHHATIYVYFVLHDPSHTCAGAKIYEARSVFKTDMATQSPRKWLCHGARVIRVTSSPCS